MRDSVNPRSYYKCSDQSCPAKKVGEGACLLEGANAPMHPHLCVCPHIPCCLPAIISAFQRRFVAVFLKQSCWAVASQPITAQRVAATKGFSLTDRSTAHRALALLTNKTAHEQHRLVAEPSAALQIAQSKGALRPLTACNAALLNHDSSEHDSQHAPTNASPLSYTYYLMLARLACSPFSHRWWSVMCVMVSSWPPATRASTTTCLLPVGAGPQGL